MQNKNTISGTKAGQAFQTVGGPSRRTGASTMLCRMAGRERRFRAGLVQPRKMG